MILSVLFVLVGTLAYLAVSGGPLRVRIITVPVQVTYLLLVSWVAWSLKVKRATRGAVLAAVAIIGSLTALYLDSLVILKLRPLTAAAVASGVLGYAIEAALFLIGTFSVDWIIARFVHESRR